MTNAYQDNSFIFPFGICTVDTSCHLGRVRAGIHEAMEYICMVRILCTVQYPYLQALRTHIFCTQDFNLDETAESL
jgi:hypothetical protein